MRTSEAPPRTGKRAESGRSASLVQCLLCPRSARARRLEGLPENVTQKHEFRAFKTSRLVVVVAAALIVWALKQHYADARADDLWWILTPTARLAGSMTGTTFEMQTGEGYISRDRYFLIEQSCAGVNFFVAAFGMLIFAFLHRAGSIPSAVGVLGAGLLAGYTAAVVVNAVRIAIALWLATHPVAPSTVSAADVHRVEGIVVYFGGLVLLYELAQRLDRRTFVVESKA